MSETNEKDSSTQPLRERLKERYFIPIASAFLSVVVLNAALIGALILGVPLFFITEFLSSSFQSDLSAPIGVVFILFAFFVLIVNVRLIFRKSSVMPIVSFVGGFIGTSLIEADGLFGNFLAAVPWLLEITTYNLIFCLLTVAYRLVVDVGRLLKSILNRFN